MVAGLVVGSSHTRTAYSTKPTSRVQIPSQQEPATPKGGVATALVGRNVPSVSTTR